jgi:nitrite reductase/ring-hydroxylating ferredoxin subunit
MTCENLTNPVTANSHRTITEIPANHLTRRAMLAGVGAALAGVGLMGPAESALAAAKTYTVGKTTDIKVGSAKMYTVAGTPVIVTQPKKGVFKAFNGYCTHQQVPLGGINGSNLVCNEHGSTFNTTSGKATGGPARSGLASYKAIVSGTTLKVSL